MTAEPESLGEFGRIERFFRPLAAAFPGALNLVDDAATLPVPGGEELIVTTDAIVAGIHFLPDDSPADVARKALRVNLSDLAAKGARPLAYTLTLALRRNIGDPWVEAFAAALGEDQARFGIALAGGDSVSTEGPIWVSIAAFGLVEKGKMVRRDGAKPGDDIYVTGTIGDAALGLLLARGERTADAADRAMLERRYRTPEPRNGLAAALAAHASAAIDVSDGLAADLGHICAASKVDARVEIDGVPLSGAARRMVEQDRGLWPVILGGGDDYEIAFTAPPEAADALCAKADGAGILLTRIGRIEAGQGRLALIGPDGGEVTLARPGWTHK